MVVGDGTPGPGRPRKVETPEEFDRLADAYFWECETSDPAKRPTINGLCLALGLYDKQALRDYAEYDGFSLAVKKARMRLEDAWEGALALSNVAGSIFWLKQQGWKDTVEQHQTGEFVHRIERTIVKP